MEKMNRFLEIFWAALAVITLCMALYLLASDGYEQSKFMLMIPLLPTAMWIMRRSLRIRLEKNQKEAQKKKHND
jgi:hypothetical protein